MTRGGEDAEVRLEKPDTESERFNLVMSAPEWREVHALAKFARAALAYDCVAPYVSQVFNYLYLVGEFGGSQPRDLMADKGMQAALAAVDELAARDLYHESEHVILGLDRHAMEELLTLLGKAAEAEEQAAVIHDAFPEKFPYLYPDLAYPCDYYAGAFFALLQELRGDIRNGLGCRPPE